jgi:uncharacterized membrane protein
MSVLTRNPWLKHLAVVLVTVLSLGSLTLASTPAEARVFVGVGIPFSGWGYYAPAPYYYGYPAYGYPGGFFIGGTFGPHHHYYHHHWR